ncbi:MAG: DUF424 domain-containing protein [Candidatus Aenigmarchaeota archaeon]|nr:DUF424 domain-containing protein [Candidatus Aenigmarchaeota archaeon]
MSGRQVTFSCRTHVADGKSILAVCDEVLLGKTVRFGEVDFDISESFYGGNRSDQKQILEKVRQADMVNVVGREIVDLLVSEQEVDRECVLWMGDVPHVQIIRI